MGRSTVSGIVEEVCEALLKNIQPIVMPQPNEQIEEHRKKFSRKIGTFLTALQRSMANMFVLRHLHTEGQNFLITKSITLLFCLHWLMLIKDSLL